LEIERKKIVFYTKEASSIHGWDEKKKKEK